MPRAAEAQPGRRDAAAAGTGPALLRASKQTASFLALSLLGSVALLPQAAEAQTSVWSATLTVGEHSFGAGGHWRGCRFGTLLLGCNSRLTDHDFDHGGTTYEFEELVRDTRAGADTLRMTFDTALPQDLRTKGTLTVGTTKLVLANGTFSAQNKQVSWTNPGFTWSANETVAVALSVDSTAPTVVANGYSPTDGATSVDLDDNLVLTFSEPVKKGTGNIEIIETANTTSKISIAAKGTDADGTVVVGTGTDNNKVTINPAVNLQGGTAYHVKIASGAIKDLADNSYAGISNNTDWNFTTSSPRLTAGNVRHTTATLTISEHTGAWYYKGSQSGASCVHVSSGTTANLTTLTAKTDYTYKAYSNSACTTELTTAAEFSTLDVTTPANFVAVNSVNNPGDVVLYWDTVPGAHAYAYQSKPVGGGWYRNGIMIAAWQNYIPPFQQGGATRHAHAVRSWSKPLADTRCGALPQGNTTESPR